MIDYIFRAIYDAGIQLENKYEDEKYDVFFSNISGEVY